jgi:predicted DNA-binding protein YlxM (UPF0122 family)
MILAALRGEPKKEIARRYGVSVQAVYQAEKDARKNVGFYRQVADLYEADEALTPPTR